MDSIAESIETDEDAAELQTSLEEVFAHDPELRAYYLEMFFGIQPENGNRLEELISEEEPIPSVSESPSASVEIKSAGGIGEAASVAKQAHKKNAEAAAPALANTGFDGFTDVIAGLLVALAGVVLVALGCRKSTKH